MLQHALLVRSAPGIRPVQHQSMPSVRAAATIPSQAAVPRSWMLPPHLQARPLRPASASRASLAVAAAAPRAIPAVPPAVLAVAATVMMARLALAAHFPPEHDAPPTRDVLVGIGGALVGAGWHGFCALRGWPHHVGAMPLALLVGWGVHGALRQADRCFAWASDDDPCAIPAQVRRRAAHTVALVATVVCWLI